jgi:Flp pilus assembly protein TadB
VITSSISNRKKEPGMHRRFRNYWVYSVGIGVVLMIVLAIVASVKSYDLHTFLLVVAGFAIGWVSGTIARYVYPPPQKWAHAKTPGE